MARLAALAALFLMMRVSGYEDHFALGFYSAGTAWLAITALIIANAAPIAMPRSFGVALPA